MAEKPAPWKPQKTLVPCQFCSCTVLRMTWNGALNRWTTLDPPVSPLTGERHDCALALLHHATRWQYLVALMPRRTTHAQEAP